MFKIAHILKGTNGRLANGGTVRVKSLLIKQASTPFSPEPGDVIEEGSNTGNEAPDEEGEKSKTAKLAL